MTTAVEPLSLTAGEAEQLEDFLTYVNSGKGPVTAALSVGWTPRRLRELMSDPEFQEIYQIAQEQKLEFVEEKLYELIEKGSFPAIQMFLFCKGPDRGWRPPTQRVAVNHQGTVAVERVNAVRQAALAIINEKGTQALGVGGPLDDIVDAEVIE